MEVVLLFTAGCPKSHYTKVRAYCSACEHLICKISSRMFQKSSSFEEFNGFSELDVHFFEWTFIFHVFRPLNMPGSHPHCVTFVWPNEIRDF